MQVTLVDNVLLSRVDGGYAVDLQPHLGLISLIAVLREQGYAATLYDPKIDLDAGTVPLRAGVYGELAARIAATSPDIVGFTALGCNFVCTLKMARALRALLPDAAIVLGGPHASILDEAIIERYPEFDAIARQEAEATIGPLVEALAGSRRLADVTGITYRRDGRALRTPDAGPILDLDALPFPAYDAYPVAELGLTDLRVDAGRGCPFRCTFCSTASFFGRRYRLKSAARLVDELLRLRAEYGIERFALSHDLFTVNKAKVRQFCRAVAPHRVRWTCSARIDCVDDALLAEMHDAGCEEIYYGIETGSQRMQKLVAKDLDLALYHPRLTKTLDLGMRATASFIIGYPDETVDDQDATLELIGESVRRYPAALEVQLHLLTPEPGTLIYEQRAASLAYDGYLSDFVFPPIEPDDESVMREDPLVFVCHQYFADCLDRAGTIAAAEAVRLLLSMSRAMVRKLAADASSFPQLVRRFGAALRASDFRTPAAIRHFAETHCHGDRPLVEILRFIAAHAALRVDDATRVWQLENDAPVRLARCIVPIDVARDGAELLRRLTANAPLDEPALVPSRWLLVASPDLRGRAALPIDEVTFEIAQALEATTSRRTLSVRFGDAAVAALMPVLSALGAVVAASPEGSVEHLPLVSAATGGAGSGRSNR